ncbi:THAP domain-containing protein 9 [Elysia marginata]|uniref:THAP domain-containing protein 9 n=1 Tax=Elysia marginata TaxID=1093978 RepID=A0AAV4JBN9_9GAST|nr:THAP domain-containing protein 9 [Elysia marginata]
MFDGGHLSPPPQLPSPEAQPVPQSNSNPSQLDSPEKASLKRKLEETNSKLSQSKKKIKTLQQTKRRLLKREEKLTSIIANLRSKNVLSTNSLSVLETCGSGIGDLLKRCEAKSKRKGQPAKYSPELRSFALTLHFYSPKAYAYVRKAFDTCLPHPRTLKNCMRQWKMVLPSMQRLFNFFNRELKLYREKEKLPHVR